MNRALYRPTNDRETCNTIFGRSTPDICIHTGGGRSGDEGFLGFVFVIIGLQALIGNFMEILLKKTNRF